MASTFLFFSGRLSGAFPSCRNWTIFASSFGVASMHVASSPIYTLDRQFGPTLFFLGRTITSNSNSWNNRSHLQTLPWWTSLQTKYFSAWWSV
jgi:hypothetical protein